MAARNDDQVILVVRAPNGDVREVELRPQALVIGRDESADIRVDDRKVSRRHAAFKLIDGEPWVEDLGSSNGVRLNERKIDKRARVGPRDEVRVGAFKMVLKGSGGSEIDRPRTRARGTKPAVSIQAEVSSSAGTAPVAQRRPHAEPGLSDRLPRLMGRDAPAKGRVFVLQRGENIIGRLEECDVPILDGSVSRQHARIVFARHRVTVTDLGSSNGVFVNDLRVDMAELAEGDVLRVGNVAFDVRLPPELAVGAPAPLSTRARARRATQERRWLTMGIVGLVLAIVVLSVALVVQLRRQHGIDLFDGTLLAWTSSTADATDGQPGGGVVSLEGVDRPSTGSPVGQEAAESPFASAGEPAARPVPGAALERSESVPGTEAAPLAGSAVLDLGRGDGADPPATDRVWTATSPYSRRGSDGLPVNLPQVDPNFDLEGLLATSMAEAKTCEAAGDYLCVRERLAALLERDPINAEARQLLARVRNIEAANAALAEAERYAARGKHARALRVLEEAPQDGPRGAAVRRRADELKERAIREELKAAAREALGRRTWRKAHRRYKYVLTLDPNSMVALDGLRRLEKRMRRRKIAFSAYRPTSSPRDSAPSATEPNALVRQFGGDRELITVALIYKRGALDEAEERAVALARKAEGARAVSAKAMAAAIQEVGLRYKRTRTEISNDPDEAWAMLIDLDRFERRILPRGVKSFIVQELEVGLSEAFADRGSSLFDAERFEQAFQRWESGFKLDPTNPKVIAGLRRLEEKAESLGQEAELAAQRGANDVCDRWRRITRMTRAKAPIHERARKRAAVTCR